jgi:NhaA family Na+:H+ antiporter
MSNLGVLPETPALRHVAGVAGRKWRGIPELWHFAAEYLLLLPAGAAIALVWANVHPESYYRTVFALDFFVFEVAMVFFFGLVMKEVVEATVPGGVLHPWRRVALPLVASLGLTLMPAMLLGVLAPVFGEPLVAQAWAVTFATDLAFGYFVALVIFGRSPVLPLFLLIAISANTLGLAVLAPAAAAYRLQPAVLLVLLAAALASAAIFRAKKVTSFWPYIVISGGLSWLAFVLGGMHPALALVPIIPFLPHAARDPGFFVDAPADAPDTLNRFERWVRHPAQVAIFLFALITAGVPLRVLEGGAAALPVAVLIGKPLGLFAGIGVALALGLHLPFHVGWRHLTVVALITTIGFTMGLFFGVVAIGPGPVLSTIKIGSLLTLIGAPLAVWAAWILRVGRFAHREGPAKPHGQFVF